MDRLATRYRVRPSAVLRTESALDLGLDLLVLRVAQDEESYQIDRAVRDGGSVRLTVPMTR